MFLAWRVVSSWAPSWRHVIVQGCLGWLVMRKVPEGPCHSRPMLILISTVCNAIKNTNMTVPKTNVMSSHKHTHKCM